MVTFLSKLEVGTLMDMNLEEGKEVNGINIGLENVEVIRKLRSGVYLVLIDSKKYLLKLQKKLRKGKVGVIKKYIYKSMFQYEVAVNCSLKNNKFIFLNYPKVFHYNVREYILFEYIEKNEMPNTFIDKWDIANSIFEFQFADLEVEISPTNRFINTLIRSHSFSMIRSVFSLFRKKGGYKKVLRYFKVIKNASKMHRKFDLKVNTHNDLRANTLIDRSNKFYIIDFETTKTKDSWFLKDLIRYAFNKSKLEIDYELIDCYVKILSKKLKIVIDENDLKDLVRVNLIYIMMIEIRNKRNCEEIEYQRLEFLNEVLLMDNSYNKWYENSNYGS